jgi:DNA-nicking Smr family endonuclease
MEWNAHELDQVDLHGLRPEQALRRLEQFLHGARVRGVPRVLVITGRGLGNREGRAVLRERVAAWLRGPDGRRYDVIDVQLASKGGALDVRRRAPHRREG